MDNAVHSEAGRNRLPQLLLQGGIGAPNRFRQAPMLGCACGAGSPATNSSNQPKLKRPRRQKNEREEFQGKKRESKELQGEELHQKLRPADSSWPREIDTKKKPKKNKK